VDIKREPPKKTKKFIGIGLGLIAIVSVSVAINRLKPAAPPVERGTLWFDTVKRGEMKREVNAPGSLVNEDVRNVTALISGRIEGLPVKPGIPVTPATVLVVLSSPDEDIKQLQYEQQLNQAHGTLASLKTQLYQQLLTQRSNIASVRTAYNDAMRIVAVQDSLLKKQLVPVNDVAASRDKAAQYKQQLDIEENRLKELEATQQSQLDLQQQTIEGLKRILEDQRHRVASMRVTAPEAGQLQSLGNPPLELGQYVVPASSLPVLFNPAASRRYSASPRIRPRMSCLVSTRASTSTTTTS